MKRKFVIIAVSLFGFLFILTSGYADKLFGYHIVDSIAYMFWWTIVLMPLSMLSLILDNEKHEFWLKFTGIFFIISMFIVFLTPETSRGFILNPDRETINWFFLITYSFISIAYFVVQHFKNNNQSTLLN